MFLLLSQWFTGLDFTRHDGSIAQVYLMPGGAGSNREALNLGVWSYVESFGQNRYGFGSAIAVLLTLVLLAITVVYVRTMLKEDEL